MGTGCQRVAGWGGTHRIGVRAQAHQEVHLGRTGQDRQGRIPLWANFRARCQGGECLGCLGTSGEMPGRNPCLGQDRVVILGQVRHRRNAGGIVALPEIP